MNRRDFSKLSVAAFGGMVAGVGCSNNDSGGGEATTNVNATVDMGADAAEKVSYLLEDPNTCRGLNACKGKGGCATASNDCGGKNDCAGMGGCATAEKHTCTSQNTCKGQGGCGETAGLNECKGKGECAVPLSEKTWAKARANYEAAMTQAGKQFGAAPAPKA